MWPSLPDTYEILWRDTNMVSLRLCLTDVNVGKWIISNSRTGNNDCCTEWLRFTNSVMSTLTSQRWSKIHWQNQKWRKQQKGGRSRTRGIRPCLQMSDMNGPQIFYRWVSKGEQIRKLWKSGHWNWVLFFVALLGLFFFFNSILVQIYNFIWIQIC